MAQHPRGGATVRLKQADTEDHLRRLTGIEWVAWGMRAADSIVRNAYLKRIQGVDAKTRRVYPVWTWKKADVYGYLQARGIKPPKSVGGKFAAGVSGVSLAPKTLSWMRREFPGDYQKILRVFPFAGAAVFRYESMGIDNEAAARDANNAMRRKLRADQKAARQEAQRQAEQGAGPAQVG